MGQEDPARPYGARARPRLTAVRNQPADRSAGWNELHVFEFSAVTREAAAAAMGEVRVLRRRWVMLALFSVTSMANAAHWIMYAIIANIATRYYGVSDMAINWTSIVFMAAYVPLVFPASWIIERQGLRVAVLLGCSLMCAGSWLKVVSAAPDRFDIAFIGQTVVGVAQMFTLGVPGRLAAVWFGAKEVSFACAVGVFGNQLGIALGFLIPPAMVGDHEDLEKITADLKVLYYVFAAVPTVVLVLLVLFFEKRPPVPPSLAQAALLKQELHLGNGHQAKAAAASQGEDGAGAGAGAGKGKAARDSHYARTIKQLLTNPSYVLLILGYGMNVGTFYAVSTLLNQIILAKFPIAEYPSAIEDAGRVGLTMVLMGVLGSIAGGLVLDTWHKFKETTIVIYILAVLGMVAFTFSVSSGNMVLVYVTAGFLGFCTTGYVPVGYEFGAELTYPHSESTSVGLLNAAGESIGIILVLGAGEVLQLYGSEITNYGFIGALIFGLFISLFIKNDLRRLAASKQQQDLHDESARKEHTRF
ncbi:putative MFS-type transporter [Frankliniella fusca]|uniref:MFS-type transporter n=1 Tax=Frankliniella fusca TaxID=407009 RepID=A0AAE1LLP8_9NEOP|nr:putative MFS-type transporter [Frankliniella fusca]